MRRDFDPDQMPGRDFYRLLTAVVVPRPIAWVSTTSADGVDNLAPHSFFTVACTEPPMVQFTSVGRKDSLTHVEATREFVVNLAAEPLFEQVNLTGTDFPTEQSEFDRVGVRREPSRRVTPPRVADSPVALECVLHATVCLGNCWLVIGRVVHAAIDPEVLDGDHPVLERLAPLSRLGRNEWGDPPSVRRIDRVPYAEFEGGEG